MSQNIIEYYDDVVKRSSDPRSSKLYLMSPYASFGITLVYVILVKIVGPKFMENRKPYQLKKTIMFYNICQVLASIYISYLNGRSFISTHSIFKCNSIDYSNSPRGQRELLGIYLFYLIKYFDFFDTFFFVLRKKNNQITFLHVYHHATITIVGWSLAAFTPGGTMCLAAFLNSLVHVIMYSYYFLSGLGPEIQKYLWWKKYITVLQMVQFLFGIFHLILAIIFNDCNICKLPLFLHGLYLFSFYLLFKNFYNHSYNNKKTNSKVETDLKKKLTNIHNFDNRETLPKKNL